MRGGGTGMVAFSASRMQRSLIGTLDIIRIGKLGVGDSLKGFLNRIT
jgi:hypothetical protein